MWALCSDINFTSFHRNIFYLFIFFVRRQSSLSILGSNTFGIVYNCYSHGAFILVLGNHGNSLIFVCGINTQNYTKDWSGAVGLLFVCCLGDRQLLSDLKNISFIFSKMRIFTFIDYLKRVLLLLSLPI